MSLMQLQDASDLGFDTSGLQAVITSFARIAVVEAIDDTSASVGEQAVSLSRNFVNEGEALGELY